VGKSFLVRLLAEQEGLDLFEVNLERNVTHREPELYCWMRDSKSSMAEVDYLLEDGSRVVPVEVKAGRSGRLRSLQQFVKEHHPPLALRLNGDPPTEIWLGDGPESTRFLSLPLYLAGQVRRILSL
jgi:hypothetical protein